MCGKLICWDKIEIIKKAGENGNEQEMKEGITFHNGTYYLKTIDKQHVFTWYSQKYILGKTNLYFPNKIHAN